MGKRQRDWARRARLKLIQELGGRCVLCGTYQNLEIHHLYGITWHRYIESSWRVSKYRQEAKEGLLAVLCAECNLNNGTKPIQLHLPFDQEEPF